MTDRKTGSLDQQMRRVSALVESLEKLSNPAARVVAQELVQTLLALHSDALARMLETLRQAGQGAALVAAWGKDELIGNLLLLHGLHPVAVETRAQQALEQVRPLLRCHGSDLELVEVTQNIARVRLHGTCTLSTQELEHTIEEAFAVTAPDVQLIEVVDSAYVPRQIIPLPVVS
jgi:Fe-S cluster biogenesis protein NfuA